MDWTTIIVAVLTSSVLNTLIVKLFERREKKNRAKDAYASGIRIVLYNQLKNTASEFINTKYITKTDYDAFVEGYNTYKALGGDGFMEKIRETVEKLPIIIDD